MNSKASKAVVINLGSGNLSQGFPQITVRLWSDQSKSAEQVVGRLPAAPELVEIYRIWQSTYRALCGRLVLRHPTSEGIDDELEIDAGGITQVSQQSFEEFSQQLQQRINVWLKSEGFLKIERQLRSHLNPLDEIRVIFEATDDQLHRLPWHCWEFFHDYPHAEMALSRPEYKRPETRSRDRQKQVRILAILGDRRGIDVEAERQLLQGLADAEIEFLVTPSRQEFDDYLWDSVGWDMLFFAGHSQTEGETGRIYINENPINNSLTIEQLEEALQTAIENGLKLAIFNSCDGVGLAQALGKLHIPQVIVMREPVPNRVAQAFLKHFLNAFATERLPLHLSMRQARRKLQGLEDDFPGASWLPVLCQNPLVEPLTWLRMGGIAPCPYRGLFAFQEADAPLFFGRETVTTDLLTAVKRKPLVAVVGSSGSGKSSVVFAGLVPRLRNSSSSTLWQIISFRPGIRPFDALAEAFIEFENVDKGVTLEQPRDSATADRPFRLSVLELAVDLQQDQQALCALIDRLHHQHPGTRLVLIIDQFEELYTLCPEIDQQPFLDLLLDAVQSAPAFTLVLTLRADFYGYALSDRRLSDALQSAVYNLGPMSQEELQRAIAQPAAQMQVTLEPGLTDKLIQATQGHAGRLPLLEFALTELWAQQQDGWLTHRAYDAVGGVEEALANHAETVYAQLHPLDQQRMQRIVVQLVEPGVGTDPSRRLATRDEVGDKNWDLVSHLASSRLVVTNRNEVTGEETVEVVHEALIRSWGRLWNWLQTHGEFRNWQEDLRRARRQWEESDRDDDALLRGKRLLDAKDWYDTRQGELSSGDYTFIRLSLAVQERELKQRRRRRQAVTLSLITGLLVALMLAAIAWWGWQNAAVREVQAIATTSNALFVSNARLDALITAIEAEERLQTLSTASPEIRTQVELSLRQAIYGAAEYNRLSGHVGSVTGVVFSPDGEILASCSDDKTVKLWNRDGTLLKTLIGHDDEIRGVVFSSKGDLLASASKDQTVRLWRRDGTSLGTLTGHSDTVNAVTFSPDSQIVASGSEDQTIRLWRRDGTLIKSLEGHSGAVKAVSFSSDGELIASGSDDQTIKLWGQDGAFIKSLAGHGDAVRAVSFSPDNELIASGSDDQTIRLWRRDGTFLQQIDHGSPVRGIAFSSNSELIASVAWDKTVKVWKRDGTLLKTLRGHENIVWSVAFSPDNQTIATASRDQTVRLWKLENPLLKFLDGHQDIVWSVAFSPDGQQIASVSDDKTVKLWNRDGTLLKTLTGQGESIKAVTFSPDGQRIASAGDDKTIKLWLWDGTFLKTLTGHEDVVVAVAFSPDGALIASASDDKTIKLWNQDGAFLKTLAGHADAVKAVAFSPDGQRIASASNDKTVRLWNRDGDLLKTLRGHSDRVYGVAFGPDGKIASGGDDRIIQIWSQDGQKLMTLEGHEATVTALAFSASGEILASASRDNTIKLWSKNGQELTTLKGHDGSVYGIAFSVDGQTLASAGQDTKVILWDLNRVTDFTQLVSYSCDWVHDYLKTNRSYKIMCLED